MSIPGFLSVACLPLLLLLIGYPVAALLRSASAQERLCVALAAGLALLLFDLSLVGFFRPITSLVAALCAWPAALVLVRPSLLRSMTSDLRVVAFSTKGTLALTGLAIALIALASPQLSRPETLFYDGTANHDGFFWISGARHLQQHSYMDAPRVDAERPWANLVGAIVGWRPLWGRAGAETLLAFTSRTFHADPFALYLPLAAALFLPWVALTYLAARTFWCRTLTRLGVLLLTAVQPIFIFFWSNGNLPNLLGALAGASVIIAFARSLADLECNDRWGWLIFGALSLHALLFSYPEMAPFVAVPCFLIFARAVLLKSIARRTFATAVLFIVLGCLINPATAVRSYHGFISSFQAARQDLVWADIFHRLTILQYVPGLATLSVHGFRYLGAAFGAVATVLLVIPAWLAFRNARDRFGALASLSGGALLIAYTIATDFSYGWQKSAQFAGIFIAALLPVAAIVTLQQQPAPVSARLRHGLIAGVIAIFFVASFFHLHDLFRWRDRKTITHEWLTLRELSRNELNNASVLVEPATFPMAFFSGMWATYFLSDTRLFFSARGHQNGGYLRDTVAVAHDPTAPKIAFMSRAWADAFDPDSPRIHSGPDVAILPQAHRVISLEGFLPAEGLPELALSSCSIAIRPHAPAVLHLTLASESADATDLTWQVNHSTPNHSSITHVSGPSPWHLSVTLTPDVINQVSFEAHSPQDARYRVIRLRVSSKP